MFIQISLARTADPLLRFRVLAGAPTLIDEPPLAPRAPQPPPPPYWEPLQ